MVEKVKADPAIAGQLVQTLLRGGGHNGCQAQAQSMTGTRKAAIFLAALGEEAASLVLRHLNERISRP